MLRRLAGLALVTCGLLMPRSADAQELASTFDQLRVLVKSGDELMVTDAAGRQFRGRLLQLSSSNLELGLGGDGRSFAEADVRTIRKRGDSLVNGAKWGLGAGLAFGLLGVLALDDELSAVEVPFFLAVYGAFGTGIGVGIDATVKGSEIIFSRPGSATAGLAPIVTRRSVGLAATLRF